MSEPPDVRVSRLRPFQFTILSLLIAMTVVAAGIVLWRYPGQRRAAVRRVYDEQKKFVDQVLEDFRDSIEKERKVWISKHTRGSDGSGDWRRSGWLVAHKRMYKIGEQEEEELCQFVFQGFVSHDASDEPNWWSNLPLKIKCGTGPGDERLAEFLAERLRAKQWAFEIEKDSALRSSLLD